MLSGLVLVVIIEGLISGNELIPLNTAIERVVVLMRTPFLTTFFVVITKVGNPFILSCLAAFASAILLMKGKNYDAILFILAMIVAVVSLVVLKETFQIVRPGSDLTESNGWSFPSGHATVATAFFFMLILTFFKRIKGFMGKALLISGSVIGIVLVCFSRLYLGAHWALDIIAGIALGLSSVSFVVLIFNVFIGERWSLRDRLDL
jgi:undecaprenyl-diphosphatase